MGLQAGGGDRRVLAALLRIEADKKELSESEQSISDFLDSLDSMTDKLEDTDQAGLDASERMQDFRKQLIKLQKTIEEGSAEELDQQFKDLDKTLQNLTAEERAFLGSTDKLTQGLKRAKDEGIEEFKTSLESTVRSRAMEAFTEWTEEVETRADRMSAALSEFREVASQMKDTGQQIVDIARGFSENYIEQVGRTEEASRRWLEITDELEDAQVRLGRVATQSLTKVADRILPVVDSVTLFLEKHPGLIDAAVGIGGVMVAAGTVAFSISQLGEAIAATQRLIVMIQRINQLSAGGLGTAGTALGYAGATVGALAIGTIGGHQAGKAIAGGLANVGAISQDQASAIQAQTLKDVAKTLFQGTAALIAVIVDLTANISNVGIDLAASLAQVGIGLKLALVEAIDDLTGGKARPLLEQLGLDPSSLNQQSQSVQELQNKLHELVETTKGDLGVGLAGSLATVEAFIDGIGKSAETLDGGTDVPAFTEEMLQAFEQFAKETEQLAEAYSQTIEEQTRDFAESLVEDRTEFNRQLAQQDAEFAYQQQKSQESLNRSLADLEVSYQEQRLSAAEDHADQLAAIRESYDDQEVDRLKAYHKERERAEADHADTLRSAARKFDAIAVLNEQRRYATEQMQSKEDFDEETKSRKDEFDAALEQEQEYFAESQKESRENLENQREQAIKAFDQQQKDLKENYDRQRSLQIEEYNRQEAQRREEFSKEMVKQQEEHVRMMNERDQEFKDQIKQQQDFANRSAEEWELYYSNLETQLQNFMDSSTRTTGSGSTSLSKSSTSIHGFASGGYAPDGLIRTHKEGNQPEFILSPRTTRAAEKVIGTRLNQQNILAGLRGGGNKNISMGDIIFKDVGSHSIPELQKMIVKTMTQVFEGA